MAYFGLIYPHLSYGIRIWGSCANFRFERVFRLQKKAVRILAKLNFRESCRDAFRELGILTLPSLYILEVAQYCRFQCELTRGGYIHGYRTRGRDYFRIQQHRTTAFERIPSQAGIRILNTLPESLKHVTDQTKFRARLKCQLASKAFYSIDEFTSCRWEN